MLQCVANAPTWIMVKLLQNGLDRFYQIAMEVLGELLGSAHTRGVVSSLIAKINDASADPEPPPNPAPMPPDENSPSSI